ncbi:MAG: hypothetical protein ABEI39_05660 [Halobacteriales archaeon]
MVSLMTFLALVFAAGIVLGLATLGASVVVARFLPQSPRNDEVLPAQYSSLVNTSPSKYPGYCPECGTNNDPEYTVCRNCSSRLPESRYERNSGTTSGFLDEQ